MIENFAKTLKILTVLLISISNKSLATRYYVNINNPTPGAGTSWASAFTDLNQGLAAATGVFDQLWVAQGIYKPTTTTNRAATFSILGNQTIYGGFVGNETAYTQANPAAYPTILSGDIGIPGDATDNSYHVVTYTSASYSNLTMDGFIITGGNANQGYPAITTPSPDNTGGGFLELETNGYMTSASLSHCTFTSNFAVYGGGFGAYGDASTTFYGIVYCSFTNNTSWSGGGVASLGFNVNWSNSRIDMCTFINNISVGNLGSAITTMNTNGTAGYAMLTQVTNCVLYDNPQPQLYNQSAAGTGSLQVYTSIIWSSLAPYPGPVYTGNSVLLDYNDLDLVTPISSNLDVDPQFTSPATGDFHTPHCSPLVDQGFTTAGFNIGTTDPDGNPRLLGPKTDIGLYESQLPPYPTVTNVTYCQYATAVPLTATALAGNTLLWYTVSTGGTGSATAMTPSTATASGFPTYYYVSQVDPQGCEGPRYPISVKINAAATVPTATSPVSYCQNAAAAALTATGTDLLWYTAATGGTGDPTAPTPSTTSVGTTTYYVTQTPASSCESGRTPITVTIGSSATAPTASPVSYCQNAVALPLTATGSNLLWYTAATGGTGASAGPIPSTTSAGSIAYYVTQTPASGCESGRTEVDVTIKPAPSAAFTSSSPCEGNASTIAATTTTADSYIWDFGSGAVVTGSGAGPYEVTWSASNAYLVTLTTSFGGCQGQSQQLVMVNPNPKVAIAPLTVPLCQGNAISLEASGASSYQWSPATDLSNPAIANPVALLQNNIQYTVTGTDGNGCSAIAQISLNISPDCLAYYLPNAFTPNGDGKNDEFRVKTGDVPKSFTLMVFNRYGGKVFESSNVTSGWNGTVGGNTAPTGTYIYTLLATTSAGTVVRKQGTVTLVR